MINKNGGKVGIEIPVNLEVSLETANLLHISTFPEQTSNKVQVYLNSLDNHQRKYLSRHVCEFCNGYLDSAWCVSIYESCSEETRINRIKDCLKSYKPRLNRRKSK